MKKIDELITVIASKDSTWQETLEVKKYFLDPKTGQVTEVTTHEFENMRRPADNWTKEISKKVLKPEEIPEEVREKIEKVLKAPRSGKATK